MGPTEYAAAWVAMFAPFADVMGLALVFGAGLASVVFIVNMVRGPR